MSLTADRPTQHKDGELLPVPMAASNKVYAGHMAALNASGYCVAAADAAGLKVIGMQEAQVDNSTGANGALSALVRRGKLFYFANSTTNAVTQAHVGGNVYVEDAETVASDGGTNDIVAGKCWAVDSGGVWVLI